MFTLHDGETASERKILTNFVLNAIKANDSATFLIDDPALITTLKKAKRIIIAEQVIKKSKNKYLDVQLTCEKMIDKYAGGPYILDISDESNPFFIRVNYPRGI